MFLKWFSSPECLKLSSRDCEGFLEVDPGDNLIAGRGGEAPGVGGVGHAVTDGRGDQLVQAECGQFLVAVRRVDLSQRISNRLQSSILSLSIECSIEEMTCNLLILNP